MTITYGDVHANMTARHPETRTSGVEILLGNNAVVSLLSTPKTTRIECDFGMLWVTQQGDPMDYFLKSGDVFEARKTGRLVVQAMGESAVRISSGM